MPTQSWRYWTARSPRTATHPLPQQARWRRDWAGATHPLPQQARWRREWAGATHPRPQQARGHRPLSRALCSAAKVPWTFAAERSDKAPTHDGGQRTPRGPACVRTVGNAHPWRPGPRPAAFGTSLTHCEAVAAASTTSLTHGEAAPAAFGTSLTHGLRPPPRDHRALGLGLPGYASSQGAAVRNGGSPRRSRGKEDLLPDSGPGAQGPGPTTSAFARRPIVFYSLP